MSGRTLYSCGFLFDSFGQVVLIRKNRPEWQAGKLNGVGGHVEDTETFHDCMVREFKEEAGLLVPEWQHFATIRDSKFACAFFRAIVVDFSEVETKTDETIIFAAALDVPLDTVPNLQWLVPMARIGEPMMAEITYQ